MVSEKIEADLQARALSGALGTTALSVAAKTLDHYRPGLAPVSWRGLVLGQCN